jgi:SPP1 gp7 family putative phage head morphogenesis protein
MTVDTRRDDLKANLASVANRLDGLDDADPDAVVALARAEPSANRDRAPPGPSGTKAIQDDYRKDVFKRFRRLKGLTRKTIVENDALRLADGRSPASPTSTPLEANDDDAGWWQTYVEERRAGVVQASPSNDFGFPDDGDKVDAFLRWLQEAEDDEVLEVFERTSAGDVARRNSWQNVYVQRSYSKGAKYANARLREQGVDVDAVDARALFNKPIHADALGVLYTRNFRELQGITEAMDQQISRTLAEGFAQGYNPRKMAREVNDRVDKIGITRARTLARTETIYAHSESTLNRYQEIMGPDADVTGRAEWETAGDSRVCPICAGLEGTTRSLDEARGLIPIHPNCRCTWLPVVSSAS